MASGDWPARYSHTSVMDPSSGLIYVIAGINLISSDSLTDDIGVRFLYNDVWALNFNSKFIYLDF